MADKQTVGSKFVAKLTVLADNVADVAFTISEMTEARAALKALQKALQPPTTKPPKTKKDKPAVGAKPAKKAKNGDKDE